MHYIRCGHFYSRDNDGGNAILSTIAENPMLHENFIVLCFIELELLPVEVLHCSFIGIFGHFCSCDLDLDTIPSYTNLTRISLRYTRCTRLSKITVSQTYRQIYVRICATEIICHVASRLISDNANDNCSMFVCTKRHLSTAVVAFPALQCVVFDLFIVRPANKSNISKDLETQQEVVISMLLRLLQHHQVIVYVLWRLFLTGCLVVVRSLLTVCFCCCTDMLIKLFSNNHWGSTELAEHFLRTTPCPIWPPLILF